MKSSFVNDILCFILNKLSTKPSSSSFSILIQCILCVHQIKREKREKIVKEK